MAEKHLPQQEMFRWHEEGGEERADEWKEKNIVDRAIETVCSNNPDVKIKKVDIMHFDDYMNVVLEHGRKRLRLSISPENGEATTYIQNVHDVEKQKPDETTILYSAAREAMEELSRQMDQSIDYTLRSSNDNVVDWARSKGREIFDWDKQDSRFDGDERTYFFKKKIDGRERTLN